MALSQKWKDTVNNSTADKRWDEYDALVIDEVKYYRSEFVKTSRPDINWLYIKRDVVG